MKPAGIITLCTIIATLPHVANARNFSKCKTYENRIYDPSTGFNCTYPGPGNQSPSSDVTTNCETYGYRCYDIAESIQGFIASCYKCKTGYKQVKKTDTVGPCTAAEYITCAQDTGGSTGGETGSCENGTCTANNDKWISAGNGYEANPVHACFGSECKLMGTNYRCAAGYWGTPSSATIGCNPCPKIDGTSIMGHSIAGENKETSKCYIPKSLTFSFSDETGRGTAHFVEDCYYK